MLSSSTFSPLLSSKNIWLFFWWSSNSVLLLLSSTTTTLAFTSPLIAGAGRSIWGGNNGRGPSDSSSDTTGSGGGGGVTRLTMLANTNNPTTFREAEVLGLKLMQERKYTEALEAFQKGLQLPGSKIDIIRTKSLSGPSPVGGSIGGFETKELISLDEFEIQAANYNMACAHSQLGQTDSAVLALRAAFDAGFDNYATVRSDPDLAAIQNADAFRSLLDEYEPKTKGFNPFGFFTSGGGGGNKK